MRSKHIELDHALLKQEVKMLNPNSREPALDYIIRDPYSQEHYYRHKKTGKLVHNYKDE